MNEEKKLTMYQLEKDFLEGLEECKTEILEDDNIPEIADSYVPIYNYELLQLASDDLWLGYHSESGLTSGCEYDAYKIISMNIYEHLLNVGHKWKEDK